MGEGGLKRHLAVDLGASGGRVALGTIADGKLSVEILHRWSHAGVSVRGRLYWDILGIWGEILHGLSLAPKDVVSVGVNSWGVDYGLIDDKGNLIDGVHHYRSSRTDGVMDWVLKHCGRTRTYDETGIQFMPINTVYQLLAHRQDDLKLFLVGRRMLMVPDLIHYWLSGVMSNERTIASTTGLLNARDGSWSEKILLDLDFMHPIFGQTSDPGTVLGGLSSEVAEATGLTSTSVVLPASHDTASAVAAVPAEPGDDWAYISSGTWSLVGVEVPTPVLTMDAQRENLTNEAGYGGTTRLLKNVMGLWVLQECRRAWSQEQGSDIPFDELYAEAATIEGGPTFDVDDVRFLPPGLDMPDRVRGMCSAKSRAEIVRAIFDSLAERADAVLGALERVSGRTITKIHIVGGGSQIDLLNGLIARRTGRTVIAGPVEATLMGNLLVQAEAMGSIEPGSIRDVVRAGTTLNTYEP